ncbi:lamin tail domain-containing protein [Oleiagrimonas sp. MCCC 1A03011]|uniref:lamin tail domain-containing protein n=1 Tax=Oleiagrimonas sp. MCCC 1A03011 TaxID=1926883 RepID=UPI000DD8D937|nr:lamin tail domain-containing protein [Oleiagrimonas sp. MCCC 1A03011]
MRLNGRCALFGAALAMLLAAMPAMASDLTISQFRVRGPQGGNDEFVELHNGGASAVDVGGYKFQASNASGTVGTRATLPSGTTIAPGCFLLLTNTASNGYSGSVAGDIHYKTGVTDTGGLALTDASGNIIDQVGLSSGSAFGEGTRLSSLGSTNADRSYARKADANGAIQDTDDNATDFALQQPSDPHNAASTCTAVGFSVSVADASVTEGNSGDRAIQFTLTLSEPAPTAGASVRVTTADDTATVADHDYDALDQVVSFAPGATTATVDVTVHGDTKVESDEDFFLRLSDASTGLSIGNGQAIGAILNDDIATVEIFDIQGSGSTSPYVGQKVRTLDNIVTAIGPNGFFIQTPDARDDHNRLTSNGVYVYTGSAPTVAVGDAVDVVARVSEYYDLTELSSATVTVDSHDNALPAAVVFDKNTPSSDPAHLSCGTTNFECFEGMRVTVAHGIVDRGNQSYSGDRYAEFFASAGGVRSLRSQGVPYGDQPSDVNSGVWDGNPEVFEVDADALGAVPNGTGYNGGSRFTATGVMSYDYGDYELWPSSIQVTHDNPMPRPVHDRVGMGTLRLGNFNLLRLCDTVAGNTTYTCGDRGEPSEAQLAIKLQRLSQYIGGVLKKPDVLSVEEVENINVLQQLADQLNSDWGTNYTPYLVEGHDPSGIDVGFLVRSERVMVTGIQQLGGDTTWNDPSKGGQTAFLQDRPPLLLEGRLRGPGSFAFHVLAVHPKSRIGVDSGSSADRNREKRFLQAKETAQFVQALQSDPRYRNMPLIVMGDFNAYQFTDGWVDVVGAIAGTYDDSANLLDLGGNIVHPALWNAVRSLPKNQRYSFLYTEQLGSIQGYATRDVPVMQVLDQALLNTVAQRYFQRFEYGRGDLDAPDETEYQAYNATGLEKAVGVSDHDGFVLDLSRPHGPHGHGWWGHQHGHHHGHDHDHGHHGH